MRPIEPDSGASQFFPDRQILLRTKGQVRVFNVTRDLQITTIVVAAILACWGAYATFSYFVHEDVVEAKNDELRAARLSYHTLLSEVSAYQDKFAALTRELQENHGLMIDLVEKNSNLKDNLRSTEHKLVNSEEKRESIQATREHLNRQLSDIENEMKQMTSKNFELEGSLTDTVTDLQSVLQERNAALDDGTRMKRRIRRLETQIADMQQKHQDSVQRLITETTDGIEELVGIIDRTGVDLALFGVEDLVELEPATIDEGQGGPFIAADDATAESGDLNTNLAELDTRIRQYSELKDLVRGLPLTAPVDYFEISSKFGKRRDPINKRWAMHYGLDFGGVFKSSIYATAPGTITIAGPYGRYGRLIEIDHGNGIKTRYGHLHKIFVKKGDKVDFRDRIGLLGNSGRSTGAHLHYEILVNGKPRDPWKFIKAGEYVYKG